MESTEDKIEEFWESLCEILPALDVDSDQDNLLDQIQTHLESIDSTLSFLIKPQIVCIKDYDFPDQRWEEYLEKLNVVLYKIEISSSGDIKKFALVNQIVQAGSNYEYPENWTITAHVGPVRGAEHGIWIPFKSGIGFGISTVQYILTKSDDTYHLIIFIDASINSHITSQEDIYTLRNGVLLWLESIIGEYHTAVDLDKLTILPRSEAMRFKESNNISEQEKNGVYLARELLTLFNDRTCKLCGISEKNATITDHGTLLEYPYIRHPTCEACFKVLKNFRPIYIKLRTKFGAETVH